MLLLIFAIDCQFAIIRLLLLNIMKLIRISSLLHARFSCLYRIYANSSTLFSHVEIFSFHRPFEADDGNSTQTRYIHEVDVYIAHMIIFAIQQQQQQQQ